MILIVRRDGQSRLFIYYINELRISGQDFEVDFGILVLNDGDRLVLDLDHVGCILPGIQLAFI